LTSRRTMNLMASMDTIFMWIQRGIRQLLHHLVR
jgi:hypothetical protein